RFRMPHSRWNGLPEKALTSTGYTVFTRSPQAGLDAFAKQGKSLFVFFQGHPEYEARTLWGEYRRDVGRFLRGEAQVYPTMPFGCFDEVTADALLAFRAKALADRREAMLACLPIDPAEAPRKFAWRRPAIRLYRNWLSS